jgi:hypothetical protein
MSKKLSRSQSQGVWILVRTVTIKVTGAYSQTHTDVKKVEYDPFKKAERKETGLTKKIADIVREKNLI